MRGEKPGEEPKNGEKPSGELMSGEGGDGELIIVVSFGSLSSGSDHDVVFLAERHLRSVLSPIKTYVSQT